MFVLLNSFRSSHEKVDQRTDAVRQNDDQKPDQFRVPSGLLLGRAVHNHPDPEDCSSDTDDQEQRGEYHGHVGHILCLSLSYRTLHISGAVHPRKLDVGGWVISLSFQFKLTVPFLMREANSGFLGFNSLQGSNVTRTVTVCVCPPVTTVGAFGEAMLAPRMPSR